MLVVHSIAEIPFDKRSVVTVGTFDGVHLGHQKIIQQVCKQSRARSARSVLVTFDPHPREVVGRGPVKLLTTIDERIALLSQFGIDLVIILEFTFEFSRQSYREFCENYIMNGVGVEEVIVGYDHMFGRDREAGVKELRGMGNQFGFTVYEEPPFTSDGEIVGSSKIREVLLRGDVEKARRWLGRPYVLSGWVVKGDGRGASLGFPTANIQTQNERKLVPAEGVYFAEVEIDGKSLFGMLNIGIRPTFKDDSVRTIEIHLFDHGENVYGKILHVHFLRRLRGERKFASGEDLAEQLRRDQEQCIRIIEANEQIR